MNPWRDVPTLSGAHVTLRPLARADRDAIVAAGAGQDDLFFTAIPTEATIDAYLDKAGRDRAAGRSMPFAVVVRDTLVGSTRLMRMNEEHRRVEIGTTFYATAVQRSGVNTEAKLLLLRHAFETLGCHVVQIRTDWFNTRSRAAIERLGAKRDGVLRNHQVMNGRVRDIVVYSILAGEWPGVERNLEWRLAQGERR
jgi:RimJ/RimL family protein N-acetyltransferase